MSNYIQESWLRSIEAQTRRILELLEKMPAQSDAKPPAPPKPMSAEERARAIFYVDAKSHGDGPRIAIRLEGGTLWLKGSGGGGVNWEVGAMVQAAARAIREAESAAEGRGRSDVLSYALAVGHTHLPRDPHIDDWASFKQGVKAHVEYVRSISEREAVVRSLNGKGHEVNP